jgi:hypothetical protein
VGSGIAGAPGAAGIDRSAGGALLDDVSHAGGASGGGGCLPEDPRLICNPPPDIVEGADGGWLACRGQGRTVCSELVASYPNYFARHPICMPNPDCQNSWGLCNSACPPPSLKDLGGAQLRGCLGGALCPDLVAEYPSYFVHHFNCLGLARARCEEARELCPAECPPPSESDRKPLSAASWSWFQPYECAAEDPLGLCLDLVQNVSAEYFEERPACHPVANCRGALGPCNLACLPITRAVSGEPDR